MNGAKLFLWRVAIASGAMLPFGSALAASPIPSAFIDWSGLYAGVHAGYGGGMSDWKNPEISQFDFAPGGFLAGGQLGFNKQIASFVFGVELDGSWTNIGSSQTLFTVRSLDPLQSTLTASSKIDGLLTFSGRAGLAADRWFIFAKAGLAGVWERHSLNRTDTDFSGAAPATVFSENRGVSTYRWGPTAGFGAEYALDGNWSLTAEYDYIHPESGALSGLLTLPGRAPSRADVVVTEDSIHLIKVGANRKLGGRPVDPFRPPLELAAGANWTGVYLGAQGAYGFGHMTWPDFVDPTMPGSGNYDLKGWLGGVNGGFNVQSGVLVFGVEGEWMKTGLSGGRADPSTSGPLTAILAQHTDIEWLAIASARAGFAATDRLLVYGKGGVAIASEQHSVHLETCCLAALVLDLGTKAAHSGIALGIGAEYALAGNWSIKGEYDYIQMIPQNNSGMGVINVSTPGAASTVIKPFGFTSVAQNLKLFKLGVNYRFNPSPGMAAAPY